MKLTTTNNNCDFLKRFQKVTLRHQQQQNKSTKGAQNHVPCMLHVTHIHKQLAERSPSGLFRALPGYLPTSCSCPHTLTICVGLLGGNQRDKTGSRNRASMGAKTRRFERRGLILSRQVIRRNSPSSKRRVFDLPENT